jgi:hypothetical protein
MQLRIRQDASIHQINLESDKLEALQKVVDANVSDGVKKADYQSHRTYRMLEL